jgi:hypothetical protein
VTASKEGYTIGAVPADADPVRISLTRLPAVDHEDYAWIDPTPDPARPNNCGNCHGEIHREWSGSAHANSARNRRLRNLLEATDWHGRPSASWNLPAEHPLGAAVCASCHAPTFSDATLKYELSRAGYVARQGVHCDYCHKVVDAPTDKLGTRFGRDGLTLLRPADQQQLFFGPLPDAHRQGEAFGYLPVYQESRYCASCHEGVIFGVHVYGTYSEWLESPARREGKQCQTCHMAPTGTMTNVAPGKGGVERNPWSLASHRLPGCQEDMLRRCIQVEVKVTPEPHGVRAAVEVVATNVGHRVPTGFIDRNVVLVVEAFDRGGNIVSMGEGSRLSPLAGRQFAALPGWLYAKQLRSLDGRRPIPYWLAHDEPEDTRLMPGQADRREFLFGPQADWIRVRLLFRRFWPDIAESKSWPDNEITVVDRRVQVSEAFKQASGGG